MPMIEDSGAQAALPLGGRDMRARIRAHDWASTPLGPYASWPQSLRSTIDLLLSVGCPMMVLWGADLTMFYNDVYAECVGEAPLDGLDRPGNQTTHAFAEIDASVLRRVFDGETMSWPCASCRTRRDGSGADGWFAVTCSPMRSDTGNVSGVVIVAFDITDHVLTERRLAGELQHRVRNSLSVVRSIARRSAETSETLEDYADHLDGRLGAFARSQAAVTHYPIGGLNLRMIIIEELAAHATREGDHFLLSGPEVDLKSKAAETLSLAFHELATNAVKFGALTVTGGSLTVSWNVAAGPAGTLLTIVWDERRAGPPLSPPTHYGFGTELLERTLAYELDAETSLDFRADGLRCTIVMPAATSIDESMLAP